MKKIVLFMFLYGVILWLFFCFSYYVAYNKSIDLISNNLEMMNVIFSIILFFFVLYVSFENYKFSLLYCLLAVPVFLWPTF